jgi:hypothetical protein
MNKIFLSLASMIVAGFLVKCYRKLHEKPETKEEIYRRMKAEWELRKRAEHDAIQEHLMQNKIMAVSTPCDGARLLNAIGTVNDLEPIMGRI